MRVTCIRQLGAQAMIVWQSPRSVTRNAGSVRANTGLQDGSDTHWKWILCKACFDNAVASVLSSYLFEVVLVLRVDVVFPVPVPGVSSVVAGVFGHDPDPISEVCKSSWLTIPFGCVVSWLILMRIQPRMVQHSIDFLVDVAVNGMPSLSHQIETEEGVHTFADGYKFVEGKPRSVKLHGPLDPLGQVRFNNLCIACLCRLVRVC